MAFITVVIMGLIFWVYGIIFSAIFILLSVATMILQFVLSRRKNPWWIGLILPGLVLGLTMNIALFLAISAAFGYLAADYEIVLYVLGVINIPTAVYLLIYFLCRIRKKKSKLDSPTNTGNGIKIGQG